MKINYKSKTATTKSFWLGLLAICLAFAMPSKVQAQCYNASQYPAAAFTPIVDNNFYTLDGCNFAGEYAVVNVTNGVVYTFSTCGADGSTVTYDSQLTLSDMTNAFIAYSDDACGLQSNLTWTATFTGQVRIHLNLYFCTTNSTCSNIRVRANGVAFNPCSSIGTLACGAGNNSSNIANTGAWTGFGGPYATPGAEQIWTFTPAVTGVHNFAVTNNFATYQDFFWKPAASGCNNTGWTFALDIIGSGNFNVTLTAGVQYYIMSDPEATVAVPSTMIITCPTLCSPPSNLAAVVTGAGTGANFTWTAAAPAPNGYQFVVDQLAGNPAGAGTFVPSNSANVVGTLLPNTTYYLHVRSDCGGSGNSNWLTISFYTGYCIPSTVSTAEYIQDFTTSGGFINISNLATGMSAGGYGNFTAQTVSQQAGGTINFTSVEPVYPHQFAIWVDWNNDLVFADPAERVWYDGIAGYGHSGSFNVPGAQAVGNYRMRIRTVDGVPVPCGSQTWSEAEDYTLTVATPPSCGVPTGLAAVATSTTSLNISWVAPGLGTVANYEWAVTTSPIAPAPGSGTTVGSGTTSVTGVPVLANTNYYLHVRTVCSGPAFTTVASTFGPVYSGYCIPTVSFTGDYISTFSTTGGIANINNSSAGGPAYQDFSAQSCSQLAGQSVNFSSAYVGGNAGFSIWVDWNNNLVFEAGERVYNALVTASAWTGSFSVPGLQAPGDYRMRIRGTWAALNPPACGNANWGQTEDYTFNVATPPSCAAVTGLAATPTTVSTADLSWNAAIGGTNPPLRYYYAVTTSAVPPVSLLSWIDNGTATTVIGAATTPNVQNYLHVRTDCDPAMLGGDYSNWSSFAFFSGYCVSTATVSNVNYISNVTTTGAFANINNTSTNTAGGYEDHTVLAPNITEYPGETFGFVAALQAPVAVGFNVWIDWNNDLDFNDFGENVATSTGYQYTGLPFNYGNNITVPALQAPGDYRMRLRVTNNPITMPVCGNIAQGETEDYTLTVIPIPNCSGATYATTYTTTTDLPLVCTGQTVNFSVTPEPPLAVGVTYELQSSLTQLGTYTTIATQSTIDFPLAAATSGWYRIRVVCNGTPLALTYTPVAVSISNPAITTTTPASRCGNGSVTLGATATPAAATITWYQTAVGGAPIGTGGSFVTPSLSTTTSYYVQAENQIPLSTIGVNNIAQTLNNNTPFTSFWESSRSFYMIRRSELNAAGFVGGDFSSLAFDVSSTGAFGQQNFQMRIAHTTATNVNAGLATINSGFQVVLSPQTVTPPAIGWRTFNFDFPFAWNGTDNIIVEVCHDSPGWGTNSGVRSSFTAFNSVCGIYEDPNNLCGAASGANTTAPNNIRPNMRIGGVISACNSPRIEVVATINANPQLTAPASTTFTPTVGNFIPVPLTASSSTPLVPVTFSPSSGIYTDALTSGLYTLGDDIDGITQYFAPLSTTTYTATATSPNGCTVTGNFTITVDASGLPNSACAAVPVTVYNNMTYTTVNTLGAITGLGAPCGGIAKEVWFQATVPASGEVHVSTKRNGSSLTDITETNVALFTGAVCTSLTNVACNTNGGASDYSYAHWYNMTPGSIVYIRVAGLSAATVANGRFLMAVTSHLIWTPTVGANFALSNNWQDGDGTSITVPNATRSVLIPVGTPQPKLSANATVRGVNLQAPAPYYVSSGMNLDNYTLNVKGNWTVGPVASASATIGCNGLIEFNGNDAAAQIITGRTTFGNLNTNNTVGGVQANATTGVSCVLTPVAGNFNANGNLVIKSTAANSAALVAPLAGTITGDASVERKIGAVSGYHYLSSPVSGATVNNTVSGWRDDFTINAALDGQVFIPGTIYSSLATVWEYDETNANPNPDYGWVGATSAADLIKPLKGFACIVPANVVVDVKGPLNNNIIAGGYTITRSTDGVNMLGNPYASPISWSAFRGLPSNTAALSTAGYKAFLTTGGYAGTYGTFNGTIGSPVSLTDKIASSQSFLVECLQPIATINALNTIRLTTAADVTSNFFSGYNSVPDMMRMEVQGNGNASEMVVYFDASSVDAYNNSYDSRVMFAPVAGVPTIYSTVENNNLAINVMGQLNLDKVVPVGVKIQTAGTYNLVATDMTSFAPSVIAYLEDTQAGTMTNLRTNPSYSVTLPVGEINNRFFLHFHPAVELNAVNETCAGNDGKLIINYPTSNTVNVVIKDANGNVVSTQNNLTGLVTINNLVAGNYVAEMTFGIAPNTYSTSDFFTVAGGNAVYANLSASANTVDMNANTTVNFTATAQGATSFNWNFGDGTVVTNGPANMSHTFAQAGTYNVTFEASNGICNTVATTTVEVTNATGLVAINNSNLQVVGVGSKVTVRFGNKMEGTGNIEVINMLGEVVAHLDNVSMKGTREIEMSSIAAGQYMVKITNNNKLYTEKVFLSRQ